MERWRLVGQYNAQARWYIVETEAGEPVCVVTNTTHLLRHARMIAAAPEAFEALEDVTAIVETLLVHFRASMTGADLAGREATLLRARAVLGRVA